ncbi:glycine cleavage system protein GcvH [Yinghuangia aomiensis]|uniref:Glycine cleavage system H protein n=1 Tax=Yinghuangia aomiensis TaxID=676205 RepID=A0ABP9HZ11_9ACTN
MANIPSDRLYSRDHEWALIEGDRILIGLTDFAQRQLGDVVFVEVPNVGDRFEAGEPFGSVESVKAVSEIYVPLKGQVVEVNEALNESPEQVNDDPYGDGWLIRLRTDGPASPDGLLDAAAYADYLKEEAAD